MRAITLRSSLAALAAGLLSACPAGASGIANFENYTEGNFFTNFTDPVSGIHFLNPVSANMNFTIEFGAAAPNRPLTSPGNFLSSNGWAPGDGIALPYSFGFDAQLPEPSGVVQMEMIYALSGGNTVTITGLNSSGATVATTSLHVTSGNFVETTMSLSSAGNDISSIHVVANDIFNAFDNIRFSPIPEPACAGVIGIGMIALLRNRKRSKC